MFNIISLYSSVVEQFPCKEEVPGSNPGGGIKTDLNIL